MNYKERKIFLLDDEKEILMHVRNALSEEGVYRIITAGTVKDAKELILSEKPDLLVLDVMLPDGDGFGLLQYVRMHQNVPVIFLTAKDEDVDKLVGLGLGADDYITKPFLMKELIYRITAVLRRTYHEEIQENVVFNLGNVIVDISKNLVIKGNESIGLTAKEREILIKLYENRNMVVTGDAIAEEVWGEELYGYEQSLMMHIRIIRKKIEENPSAPQYLLTVKGIGYKLRIE